MKKMILAMALVILVLAGCSGNKKEQKPTMPTTPAVTETQQDPGTLITRPPEPTTAPTTAPTTPAPTETVPPVTTAPTAPAAIVITKHPSSETVSAGDRTWFIASAENETQITWEFFSPDGTMYSLQQAMSAHPGLVLEVLPEDTLGLRQIPASFSGWSARARYDGPGGTATTNRATITVRAAANVPATNGDPYGSIIETFRSVRRAGSGNIEKGISELVNNYEFLGYAKKDLDGNGVEELILASDGNCYLPYVVYEVYTIQNGNVEKVVSSRARERYFMLADGRFLMEGSSGAMSSCWITYQFINGSVSIDEQIYTSEEPHDMADFAPYYYYCDNHYGLSDPMVYDEAARIIESWEWQITLPTLIPIN